MPAVDQAASLGPCGAQRGQQRQRRTTVKLQVQHDDVCVVPFCQSDDLAEQAGAGDTGKVRFIVDRTLQRGAEVRVVLRKYDTDRTHAAPR